MDVDGLGPLTLAAGDVLYLPAGTGHAARAQQHHSLHVTIGVLATTFRHVLRRVLDGFEELERPLPIGFARPGQDHELAEELACTLKTSVEQLIALDPDALGAEEIARTTSPAPDGAGHPAGGARPIGRGRPHPPAPRPRMSLRIEDRGDTAVLVGTPPPRPRRRPARPRSRRDPHNPHSRRARGAGCDIAPCWPAASATASRASPPATDHRARPPPRADQDVASRPGGLVPVRFPGRCRRCWATRRVTANATPEATAHTSARLHVVERCRRVHRWVAALHSSPGGPSG